MRVVRLVCALAFAALAALAPAAAHATSAPAITDIAVTSLSGGCSAAKVCFEVTVTNPQAGTIVLMLTGHAPGNGDFVDTGAPHITLNIEAGKTTYQACFGDVTQLVQGKGFNTLRVEVASSTVPNIQGTTTKSVSFSLCGGNGGGGGGGDGGGGGGGGGGSSTPLPAPPMTGVAHAVGLDPVLAVALLGLVLLAAAGLGAVMMRRRKGEA